MRTPCTCSPFTGVHVYHRVAPELTSSRRHALLASGMMAVDVRVLFDADGSQLSSFCTYVLSSVRCSALSRSGEDCVGDAEWKRTRAHWCSRFSCCRLCSCVIFRMPGIVRLILFRKVRIFSLSASCVEQCARRDRRPWWSPMHSAGRFSCRRPTHVRHVCGTSTHAGAAVGAFFWVIDVWFMDDKQPRMRCQALGCSP